MPEYNNTFRRLEKIKATLEQLHTEYTDVREKLRKRDQPLVDKVRRLEQEVASLNTQAMARERVLQGVQAKLDALTVDSDDRI